MFLRDQPDLCLNMRAGQGKKRSEQGNTVNHPLPQNEHNFGQIEQCSAVGFGGPENNNTLQNNPRGLPDAMTMIMPPVSNAAHGNFTRAHDQMMPPLLPNALLQSEDSTLAGLQPANNISRRSTRGNPMRPSSAAGSPDEEIVIKESSSTEDGKGHKKKHTSF